MGHSNKDLLAMYSGASADGECPLVIDSSTPSCGNSRFGCWVCTMVTEDKSMAAMIQNDEEKAWMLPMLEFRMKLQDMVIGRQIVIVVISAKETDVCSGIITVLFMAPILKKLENTSFVGYLK